MNIGILTHPLINNYGGILQAYALSTYLSRLGHNVVVINRIGNESVVKYSIKRFLGLIPFNRYYKQQKRCRRVTSFVRQKLILSDCIHSEKQLRKTLLQYQFDAVIVGSDQVWRHNFAKNIKGNYFLDFIPNESSIVKIAYAASFGLEQWLYTENETLQIRELIKTFNSISVREDIAVDLCKHNLGVNAEHILDPTFLLDIEDYKMIASPRLIQEKYVCVYWLGDLSVMNTLADSYKDNYKIVNISLRGTDEQISIEDWLSFFLYADYVITDSFHGCVFSILFHKQFVIHNNTVGGFARVVSLLKMFRLEYLLSNSTMSVDYSNVSKILDNWRKKSNKFLHDSLTISKLHERK